MNGSCSASACELFGFNAAMTDRTDLEGRASTILPLPVGGFMHFRTPRLFLATALMGLVTASTAHAQFYKLHDADVGVSATGQFTTDITSQTISSTGAVLPHQATTTSPGVVVTLRDHPFAWAGVEFNYQFTRFSERYTAYPRNQGPQNFNIPVSIHEATGAYLFHPHFRHLQPYVGVGGGAIDFRPSAGPNQWRGAGLFEVGLDIPTSNPHFGFRVGARSLIYRAPNFNNSLISSSRWVATDEPQAGTWIRW
jgi:hypothetical protein